jgi:hypothetical protein
MEQYNKLVVLHIYYEEESHSTSFSGIRIILNSIRTASCTSSSLSEVFQKTGVRKYQKMRGKFYPTVARKAEIVCSTPASLIQ